MDTRICDLLKEPVYHSPCRKMLVVRRPVTDTESVKGSLELPTLIHGYLLATLFMQLCYDVQERLRQRTNTDGKGELLK